MNKDITRWKVLRLTITAGFLSALLVAGSGILIDQALAAEPPTGSPVGPLAFRGAGGPLTLNLEEPLIRVGLTSEPRKITVSSRSGFHMVDKVTGQHLWKKKHTSPIHVVLQFRSGGPSSRFRVQVASLRDEARAHDLRQKIDAETGGPVMVSFDEDRRTYRVRAGSASSRAGIRPMEEKLRAMGFAEIWVVEESVGAGKGVRLRLVDEDYEDLVIDARQILVLPAREGRPVKVGGKPYRGVVEILVAGGSKLKAVNVLNMEEYLRGVVPLELGPSIFPEPEALKAQAVAARTYAFANRGQFASEGFDLCDTPRCQVYGGQDAEDPVTDLVIQETRGLVLISEGEPANALYTATCGGHTEDVANVFRQEELPHLKGVRCYAESGVLSMWRHSLKGAPLPEPAVDPSGAPLGDWPALLALHGIIANGRPTAAQLKAVAHHGEIEEALTKVLALSGKIAPSLSLPRTEYPSVLALSIYLVKRLGWDERVRLFLADEDIQSILGGGLLPRGIEDGRREAAFLIREGLLPSRLGIGEDFLAPASRGLLYRILARLVERYEALDLKEGIYRGTREKSLLIVPAKAEKAGLSAAVNITPANQIILARSDGDGSTLVSEITLVPGDRISYHQKGEATDYIRLKANIKGASDDRFTSVYQWEQRYTREELEERIRRRASIGRLLDVVPLERGVSGRVSALRVVGSRGKFTFRGFGIRSLLGLKENLFVVDRLRGRGGRVESFLFSGKGWGHGVGLCQVGAYGMAMRGKTFEEILHHYYTGVEIRSMEEPAN